MNHSVTVPNSLAFWNWFWKFRVFPSNIKVSCQAPLFICQAQSYDVHSTILSLHVRNLKPQQVFKTYPRSQLTGRLRISYSVSRSVESDSLWPMDWSLPGCSLHDSPGRNTEVGSHSLLQGGLSDPRTKLVSPALQAHSLPSEAPGKPSLRITQLQVWSSFNYIKCISSSSVNIWIYSSWTLCRISSVNARRVMLHEEKFARSTKIIQIWMRG